LTPDEGVTVVCPKRLELSQAADAVAARARTALRRVNLVCMVMKIMKMCWELDREAC
jgi:hypothetical protein